MLQRTTVGPKTAQDSIRMIRIECSGNHLAALSIHHHAGSACKHARLEKTVHNVNSTTESWQFHGIIHVANTTVVDDPRKMLLDGVR